MSDKQDVTISIGADASGVEAGVGKAKKSVQSLGVTAQQMAGQIGDSSKAAGAGFAAIGVGSAKSAREVEQATRKMARELQRQIAEYNAGGKATREYTEAIGRLRGADMNALRPLIDQLDQARKKTEAASKGTEGLIGNLGGLKAVAASALAGLSVGALVSEISSVTREVVKAAAEFDNLSTLSNTSAKDFQRLAAGASTVGISAEKMADIFKDVQDKVGDFIQTGGGGMADFFERVAPKVGVTAEQFRKLSGKDALQLYVSSLEKANLAQSDMVFFMEAVASDSTMLLPLLRNQGQAWEELGNKAEAYGAVMDGGLLESAKRFKTETDNLSLANQGLKNELVSGLLPALTDLTGSLADEGVQGGIRETIKLLGDMSSSVVDLGSEFMLGMQHANGFFDAIKKYGFSNPFKTTQEHLTSLGEDVEKERGRAERFSIFWTDAQKKASVERQKDLQQQIGYYQALQRLAENRVNRQLDNLGREGLPSYESFNPAPKPLAPAFSKPAKSGGKSAEIKAEESAYKSLSKSIAELLEQQKHEIATGEKLTNAQKLRMKVEQEVAKSKRSGLLADLEEIEANEAWLKNEADVTKTLEANKKAREQSLRSVQDSVKALLDEAETAAYAEAHNVSLAEAVERLAVARAENAYQQAVERQEAPATLEALEKELQARKQILELTAQKGVKEANKKAADQAAKDWERVSQTIGDTLADYIMGGGKDAAEYLKRLFSTLVLQPVVQTAVGSLLGQPASTSGGLSSLMGGGQGGVMGIANNVQSLYSAFSGGLVSSVGGAIGSLGATFGSSALTSFAAGMKGSTLAAGLAGPTTAGAGGLMGAGAGFASALPWVAGGLAIASLVGGLIKGETPHAGAASVYSGGTASGNAKSAKDLVNAHSGDYIAEMQQPLNALAASIGGTFDALATKFGKQAGYSVGVGFTSDNNDPSSGYFNLSNAAGEKLDGWSISRKDAKYTSRGKKGYDSDMEAGYDEYLKDVAEASLKGIADIVPAWAAGMASSVQQSLGEMSGADALQAFQGVVQQIYAVEAAFQSLGETLPMFAGLTDGVKSSLLGAFNGIDGVLSSANGFYTAFYSEAERLDAATSSMAAALVGLDLSIDPHMGDAAKEQFRDAVEGALQSGKGELAAQLLGMSASFASIADQWQTELDGMSSAVGGFFTELRDSIAGVAADVAGDRKSILRGAGAMTAEEIRAAIGGAAVTGPSMSVMTAAEGGVGAAAAELERRAAEAAAAQAAASARQQAILSGLGQAVAPRTIAPGMTNDAVWEDIISQSWAAHNARWGKGWNGRGTTDAERAAHQDWMAQEYMRRKNAEVYAAAAQQGAVDAGGVAATQAALDAAKQALQVAQQAAMQAKIDYASQVAQFVADAGNSVSKLSDLRGEVMSFYEAQAQAVQAMIQSAGNLRSVADQLRLGQLTTAQSAAELGDRYATDYSMALATTGSTRASYVDAMAGNLSSLTDVLKAEAATGAEWRVQTAKLFAQASNAAGLLEADAEGADYESVSLGLLDSIDGALANLGSVAQSAESLIVQAIEQGNASNIQGMRAIVAALKGEPIPAFAVGTNYVPRDMIAQIHEGEAIVPKAFNPWAGGGMPATGGSNARLEALLQQQVEENRVQAARMVDLQLRMNKLLERWDAMGMPEEREVAA